MTSTTKEIFERYEIRKTGPQKDAFISWLLPIFTQQGYSAKVESGKGGVRNIVIGNPETAKVVFTAHYDTCPVMPFPNFITPKNPAVYFLYQIAIMIPIFGLLLGVSALFSLLGEGMFMVGYWLAFVVFFGLMRFGPANRHTANDNTSGVTAILNLALAMPEELRENAAFILFDLEERGLVGSAAYAKAHKQMKQEKLIVNLDCVSDGETMLFVLKKGARPYLDKLKGAFPSDSRVETDFAMKGFIYPSDQNSFNCGVGVASLKKTKHGLLYMDKIHTAKDTVYREENIAYLVDGCIRLTELLRGEEAYEAP